MPWADTQMMEFLKVLFGVTIVFDISICFWVLIASKAKKMLARLYFVLFFSIVIFEVALWVGFFVNLSKWPNKIVDALSFASGGIAVYLCFLFMWYIAGKKYLPRFTAYILAVITGIFVIVSFIPGWMFSDRIFLSENTYQYHLPSGPFLSWYYLFLFIPLLIVIYLFIRAYKDFVGVEKIRLQYIGVGFIIALFAALFTNAAFPFYLRFISNDPLRSGGIIAVTGQIIGAVAASIVSVVVAYAITRYRFFDIKIVLKKSLVYGFGLGFCLLAYCAVLYAFYEVVQSILILIVGILFIAVVWEKFRRWFKAFLDGIFFMDQLDLSKKISAHLSKLNSTYELETYVLEMVAGIRDAAETEVLEMYVNEREHNRFSAYFPKNSKKAISFDDEIVAKLLSMGPVVVFQEVIVSKHENARAVAKYMKKNHCELICVLGGEENILGFVFVGSKKNKQTYTAEEVKRIEEIIKPARQNLGTVLYWHETVEGVKIKVHEDEY